MVNNTIFDDVFRTMLEKMLELIVPVINEIFGTEYPMDIPLEQLRNEHQTRSGERITDSYFRIGNKGYHIECQSTYDSEMVIRMVEYDFAISLENMEKEEGIYRMRFPHSAVIYLRNTNKKKLSMEIVMPDGRAIRYQVPVLCVQKYTKDEIFQKKLLFLLPFYVLRYEKDKKRLDRDKRELQKLINEYESILQKLDEVFYNQEKGSVYGRLLELIKKIAEYVFEKQDSVKKGIGDIVGGKVLELQTDKALQEGREEGIEAFVNSYQEDGMSKDKISLRLMKSFHLTESEAQAYIDKYWKE